MPGRRDSGLTFAEVVIAALLLAIVLVPVMGLFSTSSRSVVATDRRREVRHYMMEIFQHIQRLSLHDLWRNFGPWDVAGLEDEAGKLRDRLAELDGTGKLVKGDPEAVNPLGFTQDFLDELRRDGFDGRIRFEFYTRKELAITPLVYDRKKKDKPDPLIGLHHMQSGHAEVQLVDRKTGQVIEKWREPIMCPAIVGRPGMRLSSCPALNPAVRKVFGPLLARREAE